MRNPGHLLLRSTLRSARSATLVVLPAVLLLAGSGTALADDGVVRAETPSGFGILGPVGLVAVALGIVGMALGVLRQRRKARAATATALPTPEPADTEEPTRPLAPVQHP
ncbi:hypothetical protein QRX50_03385 [Amycolatopsis carbonis]|uniref:Uncharacterized protein n=1 Tax=Amycolatopsis carbonis TaxID=715471 RepID=A0A9Y2MYG5_9PSEU|nr:hypothetical protein [Amycolatopsis sp. 2-15]WIX79857.1 hypothetical protein QRX50_03385 [Amycolatopsis sp. 2-15]